MSVYSSDYSMSSINSINENIYNTQKQQKSPKYRLRKIFKPILKMLLQRKKKVCEFKKPAINDYDYSSEICDNASNETLETRIFDEIKDCNNNSAIYVFGQDEDYLMKVDRRQSFVPVHFARTETGTFFWTSFNDQAYCHQENLPQHHFHRFDRWVQA
ncbi:enhancer of split m4 protein-like [Chironomus tepperi]|uniref:enhancer of split m4 protein-like n=1 Tax=Chironomus tepperi TaxID=113505 RepID=UPI00391F05DE